MKLELFAVTENPPEILPAEPTREWMDVFPHRHPYRCLPLAIANTYGWELLCPGSFEATWNGGPDATDITFRGEGQFKQLTHFVQSFFARGIVTFHTGYLFRTEPGWHTVASGPMNLPKDGIQALTGVIETDWLPFPFTMNWHFTRPGTVRFEAGEPFCHVYLVKANVLQEVSPVIRSIHEDQDLKAEYEQWRSNREQFIQKLRGRDEETVKQGWQKNYFRGVLVDGTPTEAPHVSKLRLQMPRDARKRR
ncbi:MAG: hypothetical protein HY909_18175 [Deltaproteobacteria bacterium]|nr:hypothetical protein [Deltaproteobacteria bacterium]